MVEELESRLVFSMFTVVANDDADDGVCDAVHCSLREAINSANALAGADMVTFNIAGVDVPTIRPQSPLPVLTEPLTIDGSSQPAGRVELDGTDAGTSADGIVITAGGTVLVGLVINRFDGNGIHLELRGGNTIQGNFIGTDASGVANLGNGAAGIFVDGSNGNVIGGCATPLGNIISGNERPGIYILGRASDNRLLGNFIGTDATGTQDLGNGESGIFIDNAPNNTIGDIAAGCGNVISGNELSGVSLLRSGASGNIVQGNMIGTDTLGASDLGNGFDGVFLSGSPNNVIGGSTTGAGNVISGNDQYGIQLYRSGAAGNLIQGNFIGTDRTGNTKLGNGFHGVLLNGAPENTVGGTTISARNLISGNGNSGVVLFRSGASGNVIEGNYIGTDATGTAALGNNNFGVIADGAPGNIIGGTVTGAGNVISANGFDGVQLNRAESRGNVVAGNLIGTDATGTVDLGNLFSGVSVRGASANTIGGTSAEARNVLSGNNSDGIFLDGDATDNVVAGNYIGTTASGDLPLGNSFIGVLIATPASRNTIGSESPGTGNVISANADGLIISGASATANRVLGNLIGTDASGTADLGNRFSGVAVRGAPSNTIGGISLEARNVISGNDTFGVFVDGLASNNVVQGNFIGTDVSGTVGLGNSGNGVILFSPSTFNTIGGRAAGAGNVISSNNLNGVNISATDNVVEGNVIGTDATGAAALGNAGAGILLGSGARRNVIGGPAAGAGNLISGNGAAGVSMVRGASETRVEGNRIGTNRAGMQAVGNTGRGVEIENASNNVVGGTVAGASNVISGNLSHGVAISGVDSTEELIAGNLIGTDATGASAVPNAGAGISVEDASGVTVGGTTAGARNLISGNRGAGILAFDVFGFFDSFVVQGNFIGTDVSGMLPLGNGGSGVQLDFSPGAMIGGEIAGAGNIIAFNGGDGVSTFEPHIPGFSALGDSILSNSIFANRELGIDLGDDGVTSNVTSRNTLPLHQPNHNDHRNFPVLRSARPGPGPLVRGTITGAPRTQLVLQFFANAELDPTRFGEGARFLGSADVRTGASGVAGFRITLASPAKLGEFITATATNQDGETSEFSRGVEVRGQPHFNAIAATREPAAQILARTAMTPAGLAITSVEPPGLDGHATSAHSVTDVVRAGPLSRRRAAMTRARPELIEGLIELALSADA